MVEMADYFAENSQIIVNGFIRAGIAGALDSQRDEQEERDSEYETESDFDVVEITDED